MRNVILKAKIAIFETVVISRIAFQSPNKLEKKYETFFWKTFSPNINYETLCNDYKIVIDYNDYKGLTSNKITAL